MTALNLQLTAVRLALGTGNVIFPYLLMAGCIPLLSFITACLFSEFNNLVQDSIT